METDQPILPSKTSADGAHNLGFPMEIKHRKAHHRPLTQILPYLFDPLGFYASPYINRINNLPSNREYHNRHHQDASALMFLLPELLLDLSAPVSNCGLPETLHWLQMVGMYGKLFKNVFLKPTSIYFNVLVFFITRNQVVTRNFRFSKTYTHLSVPLATTVVKSADFGTNWYWNF